MTLVISSDVVEGVYLYATQLKDIRLKGRLSGGTDLVLDEFDPEGNVAAKFKGRFVDIDPKRKFGDSKLQCEVIVGMWQKTGTKEELPVYLSEESATSGTLTNRYALAGADDDDLIHRNVLRFWTAVKNGDKLVVAGLISYPIKVRLGAGTTSIGGPGEFISSYDEIFSDRYRDAIVKAIPRNMFVRHDGIMLGRGQVWFGPNGKAITLNNYQAQQALPVDFGR